jgi:acyl carrier protein
MAPDREQRAGSDRSDPAQVATRERREAQPALHRTAPDAELGSLGLDADLQETLNLDSFDMLQLFIALHAKLGIDVPEADAGALTTLRRIVDYLRARQAPGGAAGGVHS